MSRPDLSQAEVLRDLAADGQQALHGSELYRHLFRRRHRPLESISISRLTPAPTASIVPFAFIQAVSDWVAVGVAAYRLLQMVALNILEVVSQTFPESTTGEEQEFPSPIRVPPARVHAVPSPRHLPKPAFVWTYISRASLWPGWRRAPRRRGPSHSSPVEQCALEP